MRIRSIKPEFFKHDKIAELPALTRILFIGLWGLADSEGRLEDRPKRIKAEVLPYDDVDIEQALSALFSSGFIDRYSVDGQAIISIPSFGKHQRITGKEFDTKSELPAKTTVKRRGNNGEAPGKHPGAQEGKGRERSEERKGKEQGKEEGAPVALPEVLDCDEFRDSWDKFLEHRRQKKKPMTGMAAEMQIRSLAEMGLDRAIAAIAHSIKNGWQGIFEPNHGPAKNAHAGEYPENIPCPIIKP